MNTPKLETNRLTLRKFNEHDLKLSSRKIRFYLSKGTKIPYTMKIIFLFVRSILI